MEKIRATEPKETKTLNYLGPSMKPILKSGDRIQVVPFNGQRIRRGDVVVLTPPGGGSKIIHRVVSVDLQGIKTRGDNSDKCDPWVLRPNHIFGCVVSAQRGGRRLRVLGGLLGHFFAMAIRATNIIDYNLSLLIRPLYHRLAMAVVLRRWLPQRIKPRVISFKRDGRSELQLLMGRRVIGRWLPGKSGWTIRRPFRLFVDEASLPKNKTEVSGVRFQVSGEE
jgi:signal peptidase I